MCEIEQPEARNCGGYNETGDSEIKRSAPVRERLMMKLATLMIG
jgi:hypothetical protein